MSEWDQIEISARLIRETDKAYLINDGTGDKWVPKKCVEQWEDNVFLIPEWLAKNKGFI